MVRVVCAGHVNWDVTLHVDRLPDVDGEARITDQRQGGGGSASNAAAVLAQLDVDATLLGSIGDDEHGHLAERELGQLGVRTDLTVVDGAATTVKYLVVDDGGEVLVFGNDGANEAIRPDDVRTDLDGCDHLHLTSQRPETARHLCDLAAERAVETSFAPGRRLGNRDYAAITERADVLFLNDREAEAYCDDPAETATERGQTLVVTHGADGARAYTPEETVEHAGFAVDAVDTTGAGDAFAAGFLATRFDGDLTTALAVGNACGSLASQTMGARTRLTWADVDAYLEA